LVEIVQNIQDKKGNFDLLLCCGNFFPSEYQRFEEFYDLVLKGIFPIPTYFIDSTNFIAPFNHKKGMFKFNKNVHFLGRCGIFEFEGLRIAYVSGKDSDILGNEISGKLNPELEYVSNYFCQGDISALINEKPVDILLTSQYPLGVFPEDSLEFLSNCSSSLSILVDKLCPRYVYSSTSLEHQINVDPFVNSMGYLTRCSSIANLMGSYLKPKDSKSVYIKAIDIKTDFKD
jgi:hypothetical protein